MRTIGRTLTPAGARQPGGSTARTSRHVFETQIAWSMSASVKVSILLMWMLAASAKPKSEWSV
jgi:hypothetical protein